MIHCATDAALKLLSCVIFERDELMSSWYTGGNKNKEAFVLEHMRRACDAIRKDIILCEGKVRYWGFGHKKIFTVVFLDGIFVHLLYKEQVTI